MRRAIPSFTVEVRRRPRLATTSSPDAPSSEAGPPQGAFDRESHRVAAGAVDAKEVDQSSVDVAASPPRGRILPSLVPDEAQHHVLEDAAISAAKSEPSSRVPKRPSERTSKGKGQASPRKSGFSSDGNAPLAERLSTKSRRWSCRRAHIPSCSCPRACSRSRTYRNSGGDAHASRRRTAPASKNSSRCRTAPPAGLRDPTLGDAKKADVKVIEVEFLDLPAGLQPHLVGID